IPIKERSIQRAALYVADELFFSGTAAEITPIRSVDRITVGQGGRGEITAQIQKRFFEITKGEHPAPGDWLTYTCEESAGSPEDNGAGEKESENDAPVAKHPEPPLSYVAAIAE